VSGSGCGCFVDASGIVGKSTSREGKDEEVRQGFVCCQILRAIDSELVWYVRRLG
jgi:hypothetical protein